MIYENRLGEGIKIGFISKKTVLLCKQKNLKKSKQEKIGNIKGTYY
jgi:hypothetical protein